MLKTIRRNLKERSEERLVARKNKFFQNFKGGYGEGDYFLGVDNPNLRAVAKEYKDIASTEIITKLLHSKYHEERLVGLVIMERQFDKACKKKSYNPEKQHELYELYLKEIKFINNWDLVDLSSSQIVGRYLVDRKDDRKVLYELSKTNNLWQERIAIISTHAFIRRNDFNDTLKLAKHFLHHQHDLMHKAVGWMLREIGNRDLDTELDFLKSNSYQSIPRTCLRYAIEKFPEDLRLKYLKGKA